MFQKIKQKFYLGSHYRMERFAMLFWILCAGLAITVALAQHKVQIAQKVSLNDDALLTKQFIFSRSNVGGTVEGVYVNSDKTKTFLMLHLDDIQNITTDANNYKMYYSAYKSERVNTPAGAIYMFGSTGYMGLYFTDAKGFVPQVSDITVWNTQDLIGLAPADPNGNHFEQYDDIQIYANLGAKNAEHLKVLDQDGALDIAELFAQTVAASQLENITAELNKALEEMEISKLRIVELAERLTRDGVVVFNEPKEIQGDKIIRDAKTEVFEVTFEEAMPGGYDFAWQGRTVSEGFLELVVAEGEDIRAHMRKMSNIAKGGTAFLETYSEWFYEDGTVAYEKDNTSLIITEREQSIYDNITALQKEWQTYYDLRRNYQTVLLPKLLVLDINTRSRNSGFSIHTGEDVLTVW